MKKGRKVATTKDKNNNDWEIIVGNNSLGIKIPISKLFEKSGNGNNKIPQIKPIIIERKAIRSEISLL